MPSFTRESGGTLHVAVMGVNRIGKDHSIDMKRFFSEDEKLMPFCGLIGIDYAIDRPVFYRQQGAFPWIKFHFKSYIEFSGNPIEDVRGQSLWRSAFIFFEDYSEFGSTEHSDPGLS